MTTSIQFLHASDLEGGVEAIENAPNFAAIADAFETEKAAEGVATVTLSSGDNYIPSPFFNAAQFVGDGVFNDVYSALFADDLAANPELAFDPGDGRGRADIALANILGIDASAVGNHEFDNGPDAFADLMRPELDDGVVEGIGTLFPYLSANLDFSGEPALAGLAADGIVAGEDFFNTPSDIAAGNTSPAEIAPAATIDAGGETIGVVGATTQIVETISSTGGVADATGGAEDMAALAAALQPRVDALTAQGVDKVVIVSHLQQFALEQELAGLMRGVDIIFAGGSDSISADATDRLRAGDSADQPYPLVVDDADNNPTAIVSTDGEYSYVGRLVVEFDADGNIVPGSIEADESGAFATDEQGVLDVTGAATLDGAISSSGKASLAEDLTTAIQDQVTAADGDIFGETEVFLDGRREQVRTEETNLGNLTADANLAATRAVDPDVQISLKNGGGIRAAIGEVDGLTGELLPTQENPLSGKEEGEISALDIQNSLRFNNGLTLLTLSSADLKIVLEHAVAATEPGNTPGQFAQVGGLRFSFNPEGTAQELDGDGNVVTKGARVQSVALIDEDGETTQLIVENGEVVADAPEAIRTVTLGFLADGGDGYPFAALGEDRVDTGIGEQQALEDFLSANFPKDGPAAFDEPEIAATLDSRIQDVTGREDTVDAPVSRDELTVSLVETFQGESDPTDEDSPEGASEVVAHEAGELFVTNGNLDRIDIFDIAAGTQAGTLELSGIPGFDGVQSVDVQNGIVAAAVEIEAQPQGDELLPANGVVAFFDAATRTLLDTVEVGVLPDAIKFTPDGSRLVVANEGEFNAESDVTVDAPGTVSVIEVTGSGQSASFAEASRTGPGDINGIATLVDFLEIRSAPALDPINQHEPEYVTVTEDGQTAYISFQENNWIGELDIASGQFTDMFNAGTVDHSESGLDFGDDDVIDIATAPIRGLRQPDAITTYQTGGDTFILTANEGDGRGDFDEGPEADEARVEDILAGDVPGLSIDPEVDTEGLERLTVSTIDGDTDGDGDIDELHSFGGRGFTIFDSEGDVVFDSGSEFEEIVANIAPERFLDDDGELGQDRADNKGLEPEAIEIGKIGQQSFAFIGLERDSGVMVYNVSNPEDSRFVTYIDGFKTGNIAPEVIEFIPEDDSTSGNAQLAVSYEVSGTTAVYDLSRLESDVTAESYFQVALGREANIGGYDFWSEILELGNVERIVAEAFDRSGEFRDLIEGLSDADAIDLVFNNALGRDATASERGEYLPEVAEQGFDGLFFDLVNADDPLIG